MTKQSDSLKPETPDELLTDEEITKASHIEMFTASGHMDWDKGWMTSRQQVAKAQLLKCHQSKAAIRADQNKKIGEWLERRCHNSISVLYLPQDIDKFLSGEMPPEEAVK